MPIKTETELYAPVKSFFEQQGYLVRGEVHHCDLVAIRGEEQPTIVELKKTFAIPLLLQGIDRLRLSRCVYVAFEMPNKSKAPHGASWPQLRKLCQMLGVGMITVQFFKRKKPIVVVECHPPQTTSVAAAAPVSTDLLALAAALQVSQPADDPDPAPLYAPAILPRLNKRAADGIVREFKERRADYNVGGSTKLKLMTSYREKALHLVQLLHHHKTLSPVRLRELTGNPKVASLLQKNFYRWFQRVERGVYRLTPLGEQALLTYGHVVAELPPIESST